MGDLAILNGRTGLAETTKRHICSSAEIVTAGCTLLKVAKKHRSFAKLQKNGVYRFFIIDSSLLY